MPWNSAGLAGRYLPGEKPADYAQRPYRAPKPTAGRFRSTELLRRSWEYAGCDERFSPILARADSLIGPGKIAWGVKMIDGTRSWELYLYDHSLRQTLTLSLLERIVPGALDAAYGLDVDQRWFSISLDLYAEDPRPIGDSALHFYVTNTGVPASCTSFGTTPSGLVRENDYTLFDGRTAWAAAANWLDRNGWGSSANVLLWDEARPCSHIALATKPHATGVYFGGLNVKQVLAFAQRSNLTDPAIKDLSRNQADFDHLLLDVAIDAVIREDRLHITKVAYFSS